MKEHGRLSHELQYKEGSMERSGAGGHGADYRGGHGADYRHCSEFRSEPFPGVLTKASNNEEWQVADK